jgi:hypothetical protein
MSAFRRRKRALVGGLRQEDTFRMNIICLALGHQYGNVQKAGDAPPVWNCKRCGHQSHTGPTDTRTVAGEVRPPDH